MQEVGGGERVVEGPVTGSVREAEAFGQRAEPAVGDLVADETPGQGGGVDRRVVEQRPPRSFECGLEEPDVEADVVPHDDRVADELEQRWQHRLDAGRAHHHRLGDAGEDRDGGRDGATGVHERLEGAEALTAPHLHGADLGDRVGLRRSAGRLEVDHHEGRVDERTTELVEARLVERARSGRRWGNVHVVGHVSNCVEQVFECQGSPTRAFVRMPSMSDSSILRHPA